MSELDCVLSPTAVRRQCGFLVCFFSSTCATAKRLENLLDALQKSNNVHKVDDTSHVVPRSGSLSVRGLES